MASARIQYPAAAFLAAFLSFGLLTPCLADMKVTKAVTTTVGDEKTIFIQTIYWTKTKMRTDEPAGRVIITDLDTKTVTVIVPKEKRYARETFEDLKKREAAVSEQLREAKVSARETGQKRTIDGYPCEKLILKAGPMEVEVWVTKKITPDPAVSEFNKKFLDLTRDIKTLNFEGQMRAALEKYNAYPYLTIIEVPLPFAKKTQRTESKVKRVSFDKIDPSVFAVPAGYERITVPEPSAEEEEPPPPPTG